MCRNATVEEGQLHFKYCRSKQEEIPMNSGDDDDDEDVVNYDYVLCSLS